MFFTFIMWSKDKNMLLGTSYFVEKEFETFDVYYNDIICYCLLFITMIFIIGFFVTPITLYCIPDRF